MQSDSVILAKNINHYYGTGQLRKQILYEISTDIKVGDILIMAGPSGSGKTTLLTLMGGLRSVQEGSLKVLGHELYRATSIQLERLRKQIGFIFQSHNLLNSLTASQNVQMSIALHQQFSMQEAIYKSQEILEAVGLGHHIDAYPNQLSGGQKQRVAIARALVSQPKLILADEPTSALDKKTGRDVVELIQLLARKQDCAILIVTHDNRILDIADRILCLEDGRLFE
jgi:putative ABC transport system ATP-binding protein